MLKRIEFENYRIFKKKQVLDIKPITILFGKNNAGKSAVLKLPSLCKSIYNAEEKDSFENEINDIVLFNNYRDLIYGGGYQSTYIKISNDLGNHSEITFHVDIDKLVVDSYSEEIITKDISTIIDYIGPFRIIPDLDMRIVSQKYKYSGKDGRYIYQILLRDYSSINHPIYNRVSKWYQDNFEGWGIAIKPNSETFSIMMSSSGFLIPIQDCGTGIIQSLPIVIRACQHADDPTLVVLEEPESHLNPAAHAELCQLIVDSTKEDENKRYLIETHSHTFVLRIQRLLAERRINVNDVALYYVKYDEDEKSSSLNRIEMKEDGRIPQWPEGLFEEEMEEILAINNQRIRERK